MLHLHPPELSRTLPGKHPVGLAADWPRRGCLADDEQARALADRWVRRPVVGCWDVWPPAGLADTVRPMNTRKLAIPLPVIRLAFGPDRTTVLAGAL